MVHQRRGVGLIEIVIGIGIFVMVIVSILGAHRFIVRFSGTTSHTIKAYYLLEEGIEVARILRDANWDTFAGLTSDTPYYLSFSGNIWEATTTPIVIDNIFYRTIMISDVHRDGTGDIAASGTLDPDTYLVTAMVTWTRGEMTTTKTMSAYLANLFQ